MVRDMFANQIGDMKVGYMLSQNPMLAKSHGWFEGNSMKWLWLNGERDRRRGAFGRSGGMVGALQHIFLD